MNETATNNPNVFKVVVLSGPSGTGKTTIIGKLLEQSPVRLVESISATTRPARQKEQDGIDYHFISKDDFLSKLEAGEFLEFAEVHKSGHLYGTLKSEVERARENGAWALLEVDVEGALNVLQHYPEAVTIFLNTPSVDVYEQRLRARGTESEAVIQRRLETARHELQHIDHYKYQVINDELNRAVQELCDILAAEEKKTHA